MEEEEEEEEGGEEGVTQECDEQRKERTRHGRRGVN